MTRTILFSPVIITPMQLQSTRPGESRLWLPIKCHFSWSPTIAGPYDPYVYHKTNKATDLFLLYLILSNKSDFARNIRASVKVKPPYLNSKLRQHASKFVCKFKKQEFCLRKRRRGTVVFKVLKRGPFHGVYRDEEY